MSHKLLLADDSITIQKVVGIIFSGEAYDLTVVDNGNDALLRAREAVPDIMLIDALMPGKNGYEVCREARNDQALATVPILLLTGVFEPFDETKARESGADDFISKPFESQVLIDKVKELIALGAVRSAAPPPVPKVTVASPEEEILEIEEVSSLDDLWGMDLVEEERPEEIPFATVISPEEGELLEGVEELEPFVADEEALVPQVAYDFTAVPERSGEAFTFDLEPVPPVTVPEPDDTTVEEFVFDLEPDEVLPLIEEAEDEEVTVFEEPGIVVEAVATPAVPPVVTETLPVVEPVEEEIVPEPVVAVPPLTPPVIQAPPVAQSVTADGGAPFSEEQLVAALSKVSREVIERIVWEVVPDLAEALIKEEIKKIREGV
jgi:CheY-like chemotaxis protein